MQKKGLTEAKPPSHSQGHVKRSLDCGSTFTHTGGEKNSTPFL